VHDFTVGTASTATLDPDQSALPPIYYKGAQLAFSAEQRQRLFWTKLNKSAPGGCWEWTGTKFPHGYGKLTLAKRSLYPHRVSYEIHKGRIPKGLHIDHLCRNRGCCNPEHLEAVTCRENIMRSPIAAAAINARKTHCDSGHEFTAENTGHYRGGRYCRTCARVRIASNPTPLVIEPGDVPTPRIDVRYGAPAQPGATFTTGNGWSHLITPRDMRRFWVKVDGAHPDGCWQWIAGTESDGYGTFHLTSRPVKRQASAHRFAYLSLVGDVPGDHVLEHLCLNRRCVNPSHIVPVTRRTNEALRLSRIATRGQQ
jgi:hypothetical protein